MSVLFSIFPLWWVKQKTILLIVLISITHLNEEIKNTVFILNFCCLTGITQLRLEKYSVKLKGVEIWTEWSPWSGPTPSCIYEIVCIWIFILNHLPLLCRRKINLIKKYMNGFEYQIYLWNSNPVHKQKKTKIWLMNNLFWIIHTALI